MVCIGLYGAVFVVIFVYHTPIAAIRKVVCIDIDQLCRIALFDPAIPKKGKGSPYSITKRRAPELIAVLCSQPAGDVSHKPGGRLPSLSARPMQLPPRPLGGLLPILLFGEQRHNGCEQFA